MINSSGEGAGLEKVSVIHTSRGPVEQFYTFMQTSDHRTAARGAIERVRRAHEEQSRWIGFSC